ncbi:MAG TPA: hypothetical protein VGL68_07700 [Solirubrobacteraceae bacterium]
MSSSIISGGTVAIIAFLLAAAWDTLKDKRNVGRRDHAMLTAIQRELAANLLIVNHKQEQITQELEQLSKGTWLLNPLEPLDIGFWNFARLNLPRSIMIDTPAVESLQRVARLTLNVNDIVRSREEFRIANQASPTFRMKLGGYDTLLRKLQAELIQALLDAARAIANH